MRNNYGVLLPIEILVPVGFVSGTDITNSLDKETAAELHRLAKEIKYDGNISMGANHITKLPFIRITDMVNGCDVVGLGRTETSDDGDGFLFMSLISFRYHYCLSIADDRILLTIVNL